MKSQSLIIGNESGSAMVLVLMILVMLTLMGIAGVSTSSVELQSATNDNLHKLAFYSADAARSYVMLNPDFYGVQNIDQATPHLIPNNTDPYIPITAPPIAPFNMGNNQSFTGTIQYVGDTSPPRGSGYDTSKFRAHRYTMTCVGNGPRNTAVQIESGFYRIGL
jgi:hypothetical protein